MQVTSPKNPIISTFSQFISQNSPQKPKYNKYQTHQIMTAKAIEAIEEDKSYKDKFEKINKETLIKYSKQPDYDEVGFPPNKSHFFCKKTGKNYLMGDDHAVNKFKSHALKAVDSYNAKKFEESSQELGRASHYLQDLSQPYHSITENMGQAGTYLRQHLDFEHKVGENPEKYFDSIKKPKINSQKVKNFPIFLEKLAVETSENAAKFKDKLLKNKNWDDIAKKCLQDGVDRTTSFLSKFLGQILT